MVNIFWFRRDLRLTDNAGLFNALKSEYPVFPLFIFDENILEDLEDKKDARISFIHETLIEISEQLKGFGSDILIKYGKPIKIWKQLSNEFQVKTVFVNHDFEPYAIDRDNRVKKLLISKGIEFKTYKDHIIFEKGEILKNDGKPYTVFTPYSRKWKAKLLSETTFGDHIGDTSVYVKSYPNEQYFAKFYKTQPFQKPCLNAIGFEKSTIKIPPKTITQNLLKNYGETRNFPALEGTSRLGIHLRFGTVSIRENARKALNLCETFVNELIWRDFYAMILAHFPHVVNMPFRAKYNRMEWRDSDSDFQKWCEGKTGYPIVDAGMRELNSTGYMHNRVRMITASFLTKHLLIDWRKGEAYFAKKLLDFDLASNNGGWQWAAGCGTDAAPYFRIFNPITQQQKFDKDFKYVKKWVSEFGTSDYPDPMVDHKFARERCLNAYKKALE